MKITREEIINLNDFIGCLICEVATEENRNEVIKDDFIDFGITLNGVPVKDEAIKKFHDHWSNSVGKCIEEAADRKIKYLIDDKLDPMVENLKELIRDKFPEIKKYEDEDQY